jgi:hypothetical protein
MPTIDPDRSGFAGRTRSLTVITGGRNWPTCRACGSTLWPSRQEGSKVRTIGGARLNIQTYVCRCGRGREVRRELAA